MYLATLFGKEQKHEIEQKRFAEDEEGDKKKKTLALKTEESDFDSNNETMTLIFQNFIRFMKGEKQQDEQKNK